MGKSVGKSIERSIQRRRGTHRDCPDEGDRDGEKVAERPSESRSESWVDAVVTLLATVVFGLGWALVELERADPIQDRYDAAVPAVWSPAGQWGEQSEPWPEAIRQRSKR